jgi:hypothetical protein
MDGDAEIATACGARGEPYLRARDALAALPAPAWEAVRARAEAGDWRARLVAAIVDGWRGARALSEEAARKLRAPRQPGAGALAGLPEARGAALAGLGAAVAPWCLEALWKRLWSGDEEPPALYAALAALADPAGLPVLLELAEAQHPAALRAGAMRPLAALRADEARAAVRAGAAADEPSAAVRRAALDALGGCPGDETYPFLASVAEDYTRALDERRLAARALAALGRAVPRAVVRPLLRTLDDAEMLEALVGAMAAIGEPNDVDLLRRVAARHAELAESVALAAQAIALHARPRPAPAEEPDPEAD